MDSSQNDIEYNDSNHACMSTIAAILAKVVLQIIEKYEKMPQIIWENGTI